MCTSTDCASYRQCARALSWPRESVYYYSELLCRQHKPASQAATRQLLVEGQNLPQCDGFLSLGFCPHAAVATMPGFQVRGYPNRAGSSTAPLPGGHADPFGLTVVPGSLTLCVVVSSAPPSAWVHAQMYVHRTQCLRGPLRHTSVGRHLLLVHKV